MRHELEKIAAAGKIQKEAVPILLDFLQSGFVLHRSWGVGRIRRVDTVFSRLTVDFKGKQGHKIDLDFAVSILKPAPKPEPAEPNNPQMKQVNWKLIPPGNGDLESIKAHIRRCCEHQRSRAPLVFDWSRIEFVLTLKPEHVFVGQDEFDGYLAFVFDRKGRTVMECAMEGNAIYLFRDDWRMLSRLTKSEVQTRPTMCDRITHRGEWQARLIDALA